MMTIKALNEGSALYIISASNYYFYHYVIVPVTNPGTSAKEAKPSIQSSNLV